MADGALHGLCSLRDLAVRGGGLQLRALPPPTTSSTSTRVVRARPLAAAAAHAAAKRGAEEEGTTRALWRQRSALEDPQERVHALTLYHSTATQAVSLSSLVETLRSVHLHETNKRVADLNEATERHREEKVLGHRGVGRMAHHHRAAGRRRTASAAASRCNEG